MKSNRSVRVTEIISEFNHERFSCPLASNANWFFHLSSNFCYTSIDPLVAQLRKRGMLKILKGILNLTINRLPLSFLQIKHESELNLSNE